MVNLPANAGDKGFIPGSGRSPGGGNGNPLQDSWQENFMDRGAWWATVYWVAKNWTLLSDWYNLPTCSQIQHSCLENPQNSIKRQKNRTLKDELPRLVGAQYVPGEEWRNSSRRNEEAGPKWKQHTVVNVPGGESKVQCCKEKYYIGIWNVRSMNQGKLKVVKQEMARVNINILGISEIKWTGVGKINSDDHCIYYYGQESLRRNGVALMVNKSLKGSTWVQSQ